MAFSATGGTVTTDGAYTVHEFNTAGADSLVCTGDPSLATVLVVAGGGGGAAGGGGGGGLLTGAEMLTGTMGVTVGLGGTAGAGYPGTPYPGKGGNSVFSSTRTAEGGGVGGVRGSADNIEGGDGGCGGGGPYLNDSPTYGGSGSQGYHGGGNGSHWVSPFPGGGGGGMGGLGGNATSDSVAGIGGVGLASSIVNGSPVTYSAGGAGAKSTDAATGASGAANTGNGGAGAGSNYSAGAGGTGKVVVRYRTGGEASPALPLDASGTIELAGSASILGAVLYSANIIPAMTSATAPSGVASSSSNYNATYPEWKAFNGAVSGDNLWLAGTANAGSVQYRFPTAHVITRYAITSTAYNPTHAPKDWTFKGSNDGSTWDTLDTQTNVTDWASSQVRHVYSFTNSTAYLYYRLDITATTDASYCAVGELEMMEAAFTADMLAVGGISLAGSASILEPITIEAIGTIGLGEEYADLTPWEPMVAVGTIALRGEAWLAAVVHGDDTMQARGGIELRGTAVRLSTGEILPPTDDLGWTAPDVTTPDLRGLLVSVGGLSVKRAQMTDLVIELDTEGGPKSATLSVNCALTRAPKLMQTLVVTYKGQTLFRGRLENISSNVDSSTGYTLTYAGPLVTLRDHKAFRAVYVDSDLQNWQTDQGPQTSPDTFNGVTVGGA